MNLTRIFSNWQLPPENDFGWKMKPLESAKTNFLVDEHGTYELTIAHDQLKNVSPEMLLWWFQNIGGTMNYQGKTYSKYLVWHPKDHIHWSLANKTKPSEIGAGSYFRIVEAFGGNMDFLVDSVEYVQKLDINGIRLIKKFNGVEVFSLQHDFEPEGNNTIYKSKMIVGGQHLMGKLFNHAIRPFIFSRAMAEAWLKHNIEEVGNFEFFLPELYHE